MFEQSKGSAQASACRPYFLGIAVSLLVWLAGNSDHREASHSVLAWHRKSFKLFWRWKSRKRGPGRPRVSVEIRKLISEMGLGWSRNAQPFDPRGRTDLPSDGSEVYGAIAWITLLPLMSASFGA
jgi:hypothetical protein